MPLRSAVINIVRPLRTVALGMVKHRRCVSRREARPLNSVAFC